MGDAFQRRDAVAQNTVPALSIVILLLGSRGAYSQTHSASLIEHDTGDVQPYIALGLGLKQHGHRVRIATHPLFANFVREYGLEFASVGGDPAQIMLHLVRSEHVRN